MIRSLPMEEIAWAAGLFEGEGCITGRERGLVMSVSMTDLDVLEHFFAVVDCGTIVQVKKLPSIPAHYKTKYRWQIARFNEIERIITDFWPYLGERRKARSEELFTMYRSLPRLRGRGPYMPKHVQLALF